MTNAEKFEEVFGLVPDTESMVLECNIKPSDRCKYYEELDGGCRCETWWSEEYHEREHITS